MKLLHRIGHRQNSNFNTIEEILACNEPLSFDGVYTEVWENRRLLAGKDITIFFSGAHVGKDNTFDTGQPLGFFCDYNQIMSLHLSHGFKLGYHSLSHRDLTLLSDAEVIKEISPPFPMPFFAYPYGNVDERVARLVKCMGYEAAWSVRQGDGTQFQKDRTYLNW